MVVPVPIYKTNHIISNQTIQIKDPGLLNQPAL